MLFAHSESGPFNATGIIFVAVIAAAAIFWLVRITRRLDATEEPMTETRPAQPPRTTLLTYGIVACVALALASIAYIVFQAQTNLPSTQSQTVVNDLCLAATQAPTDPKTALTTFNGTPHNALHKLETDLRTADPAAALRMTKAKAAAEQAMIDGTADAGALTAVLAEETAKAYRILDPAAALNSCA